MTKGEYPYPPDEFDAVDPSAGPRGVHRRPRSRWATVWPFLAALAVAAVLALVVVNLVWGERTPTPSAQGTGDVVAEPDVTEPDVAEPDVAGPDDTDVTPAPSAAEPQPTGTTPQPSPEPDLGTPVRVVNSTSVAGLAADAAERLEEDGWTEVSTGNFSGGTLASSTVTYAEADLEVSARAVADVLGIAAVELAESDAVDGIEVVLELDFTR